MLKIFQKIYYWLIKPFTEEIGFFAYLLLLSCSFRMANLFFNSNAISCLFCFLCAFVQCYLVCLPLPLFGRNFKKVYKVLFLVLAIFSLIGDMMMLSINSVDFFLFSGIVLATNFVESFEFISTMMSVKDIIFIILFISCLVICWFVLKKIRPDYKITLIGIVFLLVSVPTFALKDNHEIQSNFLGKFGTLYVEYQKNNCDLKDYFSNPSFNKPIRLPKNLVVIIGESFSKRFSSLYGYPKNTNPRLSEKSDSTLVVFDNVNSAYTSTEATLKTVLSTFSSRDKQGDWYKKTTIFEILSLLGYKTFWISNQFEKGIFENVTSKYAYLCDSTMFVGARINANIGTKYDEVVLPYVEHCLNIQNDIKKAIFVHLYGSHFDFEERYPKSRQVFHAEDYPNNVESQRQTRAHYDNSIVYNDSIVNQIFKYSDDKEALVLYFSDHGLDVFETKDDYAAHAILSNPESVRLGREIPFMIYTTQKYRKSFPEQFEKMYSSRHKPFVTEDLIYSLMDILGVSFKDNDDVNKYSLFSKE